jgi:hypothetical protein
MTPTNEDLLALADRLDGIEIYSVREHLLGFGTRPIEAANNAVCEAAAALRAIVAERQAVRDRALDDAAQAVSNRAAYWWNEATAADDAGRKKLSLSYEAKALACTELAAAIRVMKGTKA